MGGEGAMMHANQSLKSNRKLLEKRKNRRLSFVHTSKEKTEYNLPKTTPERLRRIRERMIQENKNRRFKRFVILGVFVSILISLFIYFF